jgi:hypothetical protein
MNNKDRNMSDNIETLKAFLHGFYKIYYKITSTDFGFKTLELLTIMFPAQYSFYYFKYKMS